MKSSFTFIVLKKLGLIHNEEKYGSISLWGTFCQIFKTLKKAICFKLAYSPGFYDTFCYTKLRPYLWRLMGCNIGKGVCVGHTVSVDIGNINLIYIEDDVRITNRCIILCHRRDISKFYKYDRLPDSHHFIYHPVTLKKGCQIGMGSIIMPGVTIGEGAIIGAGSIVTKDIPAWTIAVGSPCKVVKKIPERKIDIDA